MFKQMLQKLIAGEKLTQEEAYQVMELMLQGEATPSQMSSLITILSYREIRTAELIGLTKAMRNYAAPLPLRNSILVDTCGTGGTGTNTFNVSTASAIVASSSGLSIAKHGNRSMTSLSGSADVLEELGLQIDLTSPELIEEALENHHMCFMFAQKYHQSMRHVASTRKEIGFRSVFNLLGPMTNPAGARHQVIGLFDPNYSVRMAEALRDLGSEHVLLVHAEDGLDEISISSPTWVTELKNGEITQWTVTPGELEMNEYPLQDIQVHSPKESAQMICSVLEGSNQTAAYEIVCLNAGAALYVGQKAENLISGVRLAKELIDSGQAYAHYCNMSGKKGEKQHA